MLPIIGAAFSISEITSIPPGGKVKAVSSLLKVQFSGFLISSNQSSRVPLGIALKSKAAYLAVSSNKTAVFSPSDKPVITFPELEVSVSSKAPVLSI